MTIFVQLSNVSCGKEALLSIHVPRLFIHPFLFPSSPQHLLHPHISIMAVVTEQTIPFPPETLDLASASRWNALFPLLRPTVKPFPSSKGQTILIDTAKSHGKKYLHIVAVGPVGNFSSKLLDDKHVTAIVAEKSGAGILTAADLPQSLSAAGVDLGQGVCMVRAGTDKVERKVVAHKPDLIEVECQGDLEADHAMHLLGTATGGTRANPHVMVEMLKGFVKSAKTREVVFTEEKVGGSKPGVKGADGQTMGYEKAREVIQKEVEGIMKDLGPQEGETVYSVHFSDVNGLSRLENYIVAGEIAHILGE